MVGLTVEEATKKIKEEMGEGISVEVFQSLVVVWLSNFMKIFLKKVYNIVLFVKINCFISFAFI